MFSLYVRTHGGGEVRRDGMDQRAAEEAVRAHLAPLPDDALAIVIVLSDGVIVWESVDDAATLRSLTSGTFLDCATVRIGRSEITIHPSQVDAGTINIEVDAPAGSRISFHVNDGHVATLVVPE
ncbi:hypothetical protein GS504_01330 [Rhodococcus hoagii]|nr:hypothetical protein [Prescottella equi]NKS71685.1 hypothetical protein [Prescottella equi]